MGQWEPENGVYLGALGQLAPNPAPFPGAHLHFRNIQSNYGVNGHQHAFGVGVEGVNDYNDLLAALNADLSEGRIPHLQIDFFNYPIGQPRDAVDDLLLGGTLEERTIMEGQINLIGQCLATFHHPIFLRIGGEFNNNFDPEVTWYSPYKFPKAYQRTKDLLEWEGATQVAYVWCWFAGAPTDYDATDEEQGAKWFPGAAYVDWFGLDIFSKNNFVGTGGAGFLDEVEGFLDFAASLHRPVYVAESSEVDFDITASDDSVWNYWFVPYFNFIEAHPIIKGMNYICHNWDELGGGAVGWKDGNLTNNGTVFTNWVAKLNEPQFIGKHPEHCLNGYGGWYPMEYAKASGYGTPVLVGDGIVEGGSPASVTLSGAKPSAPAALFIGYTASYANFQGGVLVPTNNVMIPVTTGSSGGHTQNFTWPIGISTLYFQYWILESTGPSVWAASNAVRGETI
jgi:hypothetical protein